MGGVRCEGGGALGGSPLSNDWRNDDEVGGITGANGGVELIGGVATRLFVGVTTGEPEEGCGACSEGGRAGALSPGSMLCRSIALCIGFWRSVFRIWLEVRIHKRRAFPVAGGVTEWATVKWDISSKMWTEVEQSGQKVASKGMLNRCHSFKRDDIWVCNTNFLMFIQ